MNRASKTLPKGSRSARLDRGVSLIEALVALAVMAFGILGAVGVQMTLRANGDVAKQRAQAVRIAQEAIEDWRSFTTLATTLPSGHTTSYALIASAAAASVPSSITGTTNTEYIITRTVSVTDQPATRSVQIDVSWADRTGTMQNVVLTSRIAGILPELSGSLSIPSRSLGNSQFRGRHSAIPATATTNTDGTSTFVPPGAATGVSWTFQNTTGLITTICNPVCTSTVAALLSGYVDFATTSGPSGGTWYAEYAIDTPDTRAQVLVNVTAPTVNTVTCYQQVFPSYIAYYCAITLPTAPPQTWSGRAVLDSTTLPIAPTTGVLASQYRVCRYTPDPTTDTPVIGTPPTRDNKAHPLDYLAVDRSLFNQNFLVIPAGNGSTAYTCPVDDPSTPFIDGDTRAHQPPN